MSSYELRYKVIARRAVGCIRKTESVLGPVQAHTSLTGRIYDRGRHILRSYFRGDGDFRDDVLDL
jgi:hypothetical protein